MPTALRGHGCRVAIYPSDHRPEHVHIIGPDWVVVVNLIGLEIREVIGCPEHEARKILR